MTPPLDASYAGLERETASTVRTLSLLPVHDFDAGLVAAVRRISPEDAAGHLTALTAAGLLQSPGFQELRGSLYRFASPELKEQILELAHGAEADDDEARDVLGQALGWALSAATAADALVTPSHHRTLGINPADLLHPPQHPVHHADADSALSWLTAQSENLLALVRAAPLHGLDTYAWRLVYSMWPWWRAANRIDEWIELHALALTRVGHDPSAGELAERHLLGTYGLGLRMNEDPTALSTFTRLREMASQAGDALGEAQALCELGATHLQRGDATEALPFLNRARAIRAEQGYERGVALADILLGQATLRLDPAETSEALRRFRGARTALAGIDAHDAARALAWLGRAQLQAGDFPAGESALHAAVREFLDERSPRQAARCLEWLGNTAEDSGRISEARAHYAQALTHDQAVNGADADRVRDRLARLAPPRTA
ncbi:tetratricopeptide repeat protein [Streptomyces griseus]|uniref:hypothetical protein n=1 Tax=Streptomyces griseus TaxID=1911 RepID=UPI00382ECEE0